MGKVVEGVWGRAVECCGDLENVVELCGKMRVLHLVLFGFAFGFAVRICSVFPCWAGDLHDLHIAYYYYY